MDCKSCKKPMLTESLGDGKKRLKCEGCGTTEVVDSQNRKYLTSDMPGPGGNPLLG